MVVRFGWAGGGPCELCRRGAGGEELLARGLWYGVNRALCLRLSHARRGEQDDRYDGACK